MQDVLAQLDSYYREQGIHPLDFRCNFRRVCAAGCNDFTEAKASLVGQNYGARGLPRLVVLSADPGKGWPAPEQRTFEAIQRRHDSADLRKRPKGNHWYQTHMLVATILSEFEVGMTAEKAAGHFAHVNAAKCSQNKPAKKQADSKLFRNCRGYLRGELEILEPDIIVSQGTKAHGALKRAVHDIIISEMTSWTLFRFGDREVFWLRLYHPGAWHGVYQEERQKWPVYCELIRLWVNEKRQLDNKM